jgi:signal transduction histidine kinase
MSSTATAHRLAVTRPRSGVLFDAAIAAAALAGSLALISHGSIPGSGSDAELDSLGILLAVGASAPLVAWRRSPIGVFALITVASALLVSLGYPLGIPLGAGAALYLLAASRDDIDPWTRRTTATVVALFVAYAAAAGVGRASFPASDLLHGGLTFAAAWFAGERTRLRHEQLAELEERARRAERDTERERRLAVAEERLRIARDLHDAAGTAINVIAVRAGAARMRHEPQRSQAALEAIEELARKTVGEIDQIVATLRDPGSTNGTVDAPPSIASLDTLVARHADAGLDVSVARAGEPRPLESAVDQAAYRILQEALTNATRHGSGTTRVELAFDNTALELTITNAAPDERARRSSGGHGIVGMRERATLLGGSLEAERANGSFRVHARLPY